MLWRLIGCGHDGIDDSFHPHEARTFHQHAARMMEFSDHGGSEFRHVIEMMGFAKGSGCFAGLVAQCEKFFDASGAGMPAGFIVKLRPLITHLPHVAHDQQARPGQFGKHFDGRMHGVGIGVVRVIDQGQNVVLESHLLGARSSLDGNKG